jgi:glycosyltransferase involved in cell wall biosynthesis
MDLSIVIPVYNEEASVEALCEELHGILARLNRACEVVLVDDASTDGTPAVLGRVCSRFPESRRLRLVPHSGQSAAMAAGFRAARAPVIVTLDADGQNDPADIPRLLDKLSACDMVCGYRANRRDSFAKRVGSRIGNGVRNHLLGEAIVDTGCTLKAFKADLVRNLFVWDGMHRFLPALAALSGAVIVQIPVNHRPRRAGQSKYTNLGRLTRVVADVLAVRWMRKRSRRFRVEED